MHNLCTGGLRVLMPLIDVASNKQRLPTQIDVVGAIIDSGLDNFVAKVGIRPHSGDENLSARG